MTEPTKLKIKIHELSLEKRLGLLHIHNQIKEMGYQVQEEWEMDDNSIEITVNRWV